MFAAGDTKASPIGSRWRQNSGRGSGPSDLAATADLRPPTTTRKTPLRRAGGRFASAPSPRSEMRSWTGSLTRLCELHREGVHYSADPKEVSHWPPEPSPSSWALGGGPCGPRGGRRFSPKSCCEQSPRCGLAATKRHPETARRCSGCKLEKVAHANFVRAVRTPGAVIAGGG